MNDEMVPHAKFQTEKINELPATLSRGYSVGQFGLKGYICRTHEISLIEVQ